MPAKRERKAYSREERKMMIAQAFMVMATRNQTQATVAEIAKFLHVTPSGKLRAILWEMVIDGELHVEQEEFPSGVVAFRRLYSLAHEPEVPKPAQREVKITVNGRSQYEIVF